jgi:hypothetical protein
MIAFVVCFAVAQPLCKLFLILLCELLFSVIGTIANIKYSQGNPPKF